MNVPCWSKELTSRALKMWSDGSTATEIAAALGHGLTRNAVISKVHRSGVAKREAGRKPSRPKARTPVQVVPPPPPIPPPRVEPPEAGRPFHIVILDPAPGYGVEATLALTASMCHWPIGDPRSPDFRYCCRPAKQRAFAPFYCEAHGKIARDDIRGRRDRSHLARQNGRIKASTYHIKPDAREMFDG